MFAAAATSVDQTRDTRTGDAGEYVRVLGLPWLEAMIPARAVAASKPPVRLAALYMPNGVHEDKWTPEGEGSDFMLSSMLQPLADLKHSVLMTTNLWNEVVKDGSCTFQDGPGFSPALASPRRRAST